MTLTDSWIFTWRCFKNLFNHHIFIKHLFGARYLTRFWGHDNKQGNSCCVSLCFMGGKTRKSLSHRTSATNQQLSTEATSTGNTVVLPRFESHLTHSWAVSFFELFHLLTLVSLFIKGVKNNAYLIALAWRIKWINTCEALYTVPGSKDSVKFIHVYCHYYFLGN